MSRKMPKENANSAADKSLDRVGVVLRGMGPISVIISFELLGGDGSRRDERSIYLPEIICCLMWEETGDGSAGLDREGGGAVDKVKREVGCELVEMNKGLTCTFGGKSKLWGTIMQAGCCDALWHADECACGCVCVASWECGRESTSLVVGVAWTGFKGERGCWDPVCSWTLVEVVSRRFWWRLGDRLPRVPGE